MEVIKAAIWCEKSGFMDTVIKGLYGENVVLSKRA